MQTVLYLHGFLSGPGSKKACVLRDLCEAEGANYVAPDLNMSPKDAAALIWSEYEKAAAVGTVAVAGASLGGFYAAWLAGRTGIRAVLLNPAVEPWDIVKLYNGEYKSFTGDKIVRVTPDYADQLRARLMPSPLPIRHAFSWCFVRETKCSTGGAPQNVFPMCRAL